MNYRYLVMVIFVGLGVAFFLHVAIGEVAGDARSALLASAAEAPGFSAREVAECLNGKEARLYGAAWEGHTENQLKLFGAAAGSLAYVECMPTERSVLAPECQNADIQAFPTWTFAGGERVVGEVSLRELRIRAACSLGF